MCRTSASRKFAMTYHLLVSSKEKTGTPALTWAPAEMLRLMTRPEKGALSLQSCHCGSGFVDSVGRRKAMGQEWFQAVQSVMGLCELSIQSGQLSFSLFQDESVILRVDFEKHVAFLHRLVVLQIELEDLTTHTRRNAYHVGARSRVVGPRMSLDDSPDVKCDDHRAGDDDQRCDLANEFVPKTDIFIRRSLRLLDRVMHGRSVLIEDDPSGER